MRAAALLVPLLLLLPHAACKKRAAEPAALDQAGFAAEMASALRRAGDDTAYVYDAEEFQLQRLDDEGELAGYINLRNVYAEYLAAEAAGRAALIAHFATGIREGAVNETLPAYTEARGRILPVVHDRAYREGVRLQSLQVGEEARYVGRPLADDFTVGLVLDHERSMRWLDQEALTGWEIDQEEAYEVAVANLRRRSDDDFHQPSPPLGLYQSPWQDSYDAARLVLPDLIRALPVKGSPVAMAPNRDVLLVAGSDDPEALAAMAERAAKILDGPRPMSGLALILEGDVWTPYLPPANSAAYAAFRRLQLETLIEAYHMQKELLDGIHEAQNVDLFVAAFMGFERPGGELVSVAAWTRGVDTLLPRTDRLLFIDLDRPGDDKEVADLPWAEVERRFSDLLEPHPGYPPRFLVRSFPDL